MKNKKLDITVIIPIHELDEKSELLLEKAVDSIFAQSILPVEVLYVIPDGLDVKHLNKINKVHGKKVKISITYNSGETDFCSQVNLGVSKIETRYFSILEFDDEYTPSYFKQLDDFLTSSEYGDLDAYLPTTVLTTPVGHNISFANTAAWAQGFTNIAGKLDLASTLNQDIFMVSGAVISKEAFEEIGGFKKDIKIYFVYEFLLRFLNTDHSAVVLPKVGYKHMVTREGSLFQSYRDAVTGIKPDEAKFFLDVAKKEYHYNPNEIVREIKYSPADEA